MKSYAAPKVRSVHAGLLARVIIKIRFAYWRWEARASKRKALKAMHRRNACT